MPISQIYISESSNAALPPQLQALTQTVRNYLPEETYTLYNNETLRDFLGHHYGGEVVRAYDRLRSFCYRADLGRYAILLKNGGWYFDIGTRIHTPIHFHPDVQFIAFREQLLAGNCTWACQTAVLYAAPGHPVFQKALERVLWNIQHNHYGPNPLCPTGPIVLGRAIAQCDLELAQPTLVIGESMRLTPIHQNKNLAFVLPDGTIFAFHKPAGSGDLTALGAQGTNNYVQLWQQRQVYAP